MITDYFRVESEAMTISSASAGVSKRYDLLGAHDAAFVVAVSGVYDNVVSVDVAGAASATAAGTTSAGDVAGFTLGGVSTLINAANGVRGIRLSPSSASTSLTSFTMTAADKTVTLTWTNSTALLNSSAWSATAGYFGSTVGSTAEGGLVALVDSIYAAVDYYWPGIFTKSTPSTAALAMRLNDRIPGGIGYNTKVATGPAAAWTHAQGRIAIDPERCTQRYVGVNISTVATALDVAVSFIADQDYMSGRPVGRDVKWSS